MGYLLDPIIDFVINAIRGWWNNFCDEGIYWHTHILKALFAQGQSFANNKKRFLPRLPNPIVEDHILPKAGDILEG